MMFSLEVEKATPYAPKELNGEYRLVINGRKMRVEKLDDGEKARATCHKLDNWNMVDGINLCLERIADKKRENKKPICVGDRVKVANPEKAYVNCIDWVGRNCNSAKDAAAYRKGNKPAENMIGEVLHIAPYGGNSDHMLAYIRVGAPFDFYDCYLIAVDGLERV